MRTRFCTSCIVTNLFLRRKVYDRDRETPKNPYKQLSVNRQPTEALEHHLVLTILQGGPKKYSASEMTYIASGGALNSTHSPQKVSHYQIIKKSY